MTTDSHHEAPFIVLLEGTTEEALAIAFAAGADRGDVAAQSASTEGTVALTARSADGRYALRTLLEMGHARLPTPARRSTPGAAPERAPRT
jgi:hypothetical protein